MIKLSNLKDDEMALVDGAIIEVGDIRDYLEEYKNKTMYSTIQDNPNFKAKEIIEDAVYELYEAGGMYEDWDNHFLESVTEQDIQDIQNVFDRMVERNLSVNTVYVQDEEIKNDLLEELENE